MRKFNQYYTEHKVGLRLAKALESIVEKGTCLELSAGRGALIEPLLTSKKIKHLVTCDIDVENWSELNKRFPFAENILADVVSPNFKSIEEKYREFFDIAVCNPPFGWIESNEYIRSMLADSGFYGFAKHKRIRLEVIFILQNIKMMREGGVLAIILPELITKGDLFCEFRSFLANKGSIIREIVNESREFKGTEARTGIYIFKKGETTTDKETKFIDNYLVNENESDGGRNENLPGSPKVLVKRGQWTGKQCRSSEFQTFHTSNFKDLDGRAAYAADTKKVSPIASMAAGVVAERGDCVIARVGTRVLGNIGYIKTGKHVVSDCIFVIKLGNVNMAEKFCDLWLLNKCSWVDSHAKGTCARYIKKIDVVERAEEILKKIELENSRLSLAKV